MAPPLALTFVESASRADTLPDSPAEVAFVGRSNVGKSALVNALANRKQLARVSNTPGRTQLINLFTLPSGATVVDLPGYGFAKVPTREKAKWQPMIEGYLLNREPLQALLLLVDGEIGPTPLDEQMLGWVNDNGITTVVVATKIDKVKPSRLAGRKQQLARACGLHEGDIFWVSSTKGTGLDALRAHIRLLLGEQ
ncbi:MAG: ribosome biogenesis GTP-binding protein YihA/YsxC [Ilumatobacteraceae bacterium]|jgi:GTP-binding protein